MLGLVQLAFVRFKADNVYSVQSIDDILDFFPKHSSDFKTETLYKVLWPHMKNPGSFSASDYHNAFILCLGVSKADIVAKAKALKRVQKLPTTFMQEYEAEKSSVPSVSQKEAAKKLKDKEMRQSTVARERMETLAAALEPHDAPRSQKTKEQGKKKTESTMQKGLNAMLSYSPVKRFSDKSGAQELLGVSEKSFSGTLNNGKRKSDRMSETSSKKPRQSTRSVSMQKKDETPCVPDSCSKKATLAPLIKSKVHPTEDVPESQKQNSPAKNVNRSLFCTDNEDMETSKCDDEDILKETNIGDDFDFENLVVLNRETANDDDDSEGKEDEDDDSKANDEVLPTHSVEKRTKRKSLVVESDTEASDCSYTPSETKLKDYETLVIKLRSEISCLKRREKELESQIEESQGIIDDLKCINIDLQRKLLKAENTLKPSSSQAHGRGGAVLEFQRKSSSPAHAEKTQKTSLTQAHGNTAKTSSLNQDYQTNDKIADLIKDALENPDSHELRRDSDGMIHIGNGIWVTDELFKTKLCKLSVKSSIALGDLMEFIWKKQGLAEHSLDGGVSPKTPMSMRKKAATPSKREACLGFFRARKMAEGVTDKMALDMAVEYEGKKIMRDKFSRTAKSLKKSSYAANA